MPPPTDSDLFRKKATRAYTLFSVGLVLLVVAVAVIGWVWASWLGLIIGGFVAAMLAAVGWFAATLVWVMSQDGA